MLGSGLVASLASSTFGVLARAQAGFVGPLEGPRAWLVWWLADAAGAIIVAPVLLLALEDRAPRRGREGVRFEALLLAATLVLFSATVLSGVAGPAYTLPIFALLLPLVVWPAFRFGPLATSIVVVTIAAIALAGAAPWTSCARSISTSVSWPSTRPQPTSTRRASGWRSAKGRSSPTCLPRTPRPWPAVSSCWARLFAARNHG